MTSRRHHDPCFIYGLLDPRSATIFYIGISAEPQKRFPQHRLDRASAAWARVNEIVAAKQQPQLIVFWELSSRDYARDVEKRVIRQFDGLTNNTKRVAQQLKRADQRPKHVGV